VEGEPSILVANFINSNKESTVKSIDVLPFANLSQNTEEEYFCDGLVEDIITDLSLLHSLLVISRNSTFAYKESSLDIRTIARELGAGFVLQGGVRRFGNRLRVTAQLVDATSGENTWSKKYDSDSEDLFAIQDEITSDIVDTLEVKLVSGEHARIRRSRIKTAAGREVLYRGMYHHYKYEESESSIAKQYFEELTRLEPDSILGYGWLTHSLGFSLIVGWLEPTTGLKLLKENVDKCLAIDDEDPFALLGDTIYKGITSDHEGALAVATKNVELTPNLDDAHRLLGWIQMLNGDSKAAVKSLKRSMRLCPVMVAISYGLLGTAYRNAGLYDESIEIFNDCIEHFPEFYHAHVGLATIYTVRGDTEKARKEVEHILRIVPNYTVKQYLTPNMYKNKAEFEYWGQVLEEAGIPAE
jgi:adenylate cyclase